MTRALPLLLVIAAGCSGGGGGGSDSPGGFVRLEHRVTSGGAEATFARAEFSDVSATRPKRGRCAVPVEETAGGTWRDVGDTVTLTRDGAEPLVLSRATLGSLVVYGADGLAGTLTPAGTEFDVTLAGNEDVSARTWAAALGIPAPIDPGEIVNQIGFSAEQPFTWAPSDAEEVLVEIASGGHIDLVCRASGGAGQIVVPEEQNAELSSAGGTITYRAVQRRHASLGGDAVSLEGQSVVIVPYQ